MSVIESTKGALKKIGADFRALANRVVFLEKSLNYLTPKVSVVRYDPDCDGIYRKIDFIRSDGTLIQATRLEHDIGLEVNGGVYNKRTTLIYDETGINVIDQTSYLLKYDACGSVISETLIS